jgi:hypothetical protein
MLSHHEAMSAYPKRRSGLRARAVDGETLLLDRERQLVHQLNITATYIWERCDGRHSLVHIADELGHAFDIDADTVTTDVAATVRQLEAAGHVELQPELPAS